MKNKLFDNGAYVIVGVLDVFHLYKYFGEALVLMRAGLEFYEDALELVC